jgi:hypothetical protein
MYTYSKIYTLNFICQLFYGIKKTGVHDLASAKVNTRFLFLICENALG